MTDAPASLSAVGLWRSRGYGWVLDVGNDGAFTVSDVTAISNAVADRGGPGACRSAFEVLPPGGHAPLRVRHRGDVTVYGFDPIARADIAPPHAVDADPVRNFEVLWRQFQEHYAFFALRGVDWADTYARLRPRLASVVDGDGLWDLAAEMIAPLKDSHVSITGDGRALDVTSPIRERKLAVQKALGVPAWVEDRERYTQGIGQVFGEMFLGGRFRTTANGMMMYGEIEPGIGYLALFGEFGHADTDRSRAALDLPRPRVEAASFLADEIEGLRGGLDEAVAALAGMRGVIVDARLNYGGYDRLGLDFAGRFTDRPRVAYRKKTWQAGAVVAEQAIEITPAGPSLSHLPVWLLTGRQTASAGEILTLALSACPQVTRVGEATLGILSDNLYKRLPNGWEVSLSNEIYEDPDGVVWEALGVPPHVEAPVFDPVDVRRGFRATVDRALGLARAALAP